MAETSIDVSDLLVYLSQHSAVSGIQRVVVEVIPFLAASYDTQFVAYSESCHDLVEVPEVDLEALIRLTRTMGDDFVAKQQVCARAMDMRASLLDREPAEMTAGHVVLVLGAAWTFPRFFNALHARKAKGIHVVVLLYDLIPALLPLFPDDTTQLFKRYVWDVLHVADRVPAISRSSRHDLEEYARKAGVEPPTGGVTTLPSGLDPQVPSAQFSSHALREATSKPYVLMVATIEARKRHELALRAWQILLDQLGADKVPTLVCVGRLGWNIKDFLREYAETNGLNGKLRIISNGVPDSDLRALYANCLFTIYPSAYEGWGLPVSESLAFGKAVISADNSSLQEAGLDLAIYPQKFTAESLAHEASRLLLEPSYREALEQRIATEYRPPDWRQVADVLSDEVEAAREQGVRTQMLPLLKSGLEYPLGRAKAFQGDAMAGWAFKQYLDFERRLPITGQLGDVERESIGNFVVNGPVTAQTDVGCGFQSGQPITFEFRREDLASNLLVVGIGRSQHKLSAHTVSSWGSSVTPLNFGRPLVVPLPEQGGLDIRLSVTFEFEMANPAEWPDAVIQSFVILRSDDLAARATLLSYDLQPSDSAQVCSDERVTELTETLNGLLNSRSWRITAPLRRLTQRSRSQ